MLFWLFEKSPTFGKFVHITLYIYTFSLPLVITWRGSNAQPSGNAGWIPLMGMVLAISGVVVRYRSHPFVRHLTLLGNPRS